MSSVQTHSLAPMDAPAKAAAIRQGKPVMDGYGKPLTLNGHGEWVNEIGDTPCPRDGEMTNRKCWKCGWTRTASPTATVERVSPNPEKPISAEDQTRIRAAMEAHETTRQALRDTVLDAKNNGAGMRALQAFTGFSTNTINRWRKERAESEGA